MYVCVLHCNLKYLMNITQHLDFLFSALLHLVSTIVHTCNNWFYPALNNMNHLDIQNEHWNLTCGDLSLFMAANNEDVGLDPHDDDTRLNLFSSFAYISSTFSSSTTTAASSLFGNNPNGPVVAFNNCHEMIPMWWGAAGTILATFLIEYDRFLAIRYPLLYPEMVSDERSIFACIASQIGCLCFVLTIRHMSPESFLCEKVVGDLLIQVYIC